VDQEHPLLAGKVWPDRSSEQRARVLVEILDTERFYVDSLGVVADVGGVYVCVCMCSS
jgi:hypothetical protein